MQGSKLALLPLAISTAIFSVTPSVNAEQASFESGEVVNNDLEVIVVSGSKTDKALGDVAGSVSVITQEDIDSQVVSDLNQLFKYEPGIEVTGTSGQAQNIIVRGMGGDRVLLIKDGMRLSEGYGANGKNDVVGRGFIDTDTLKQVEVAKGAASSLYGSDALGGIVIFTTKDASDYLEDGENFAANVKAGYTDVTNQSSLTTTFALKTGDFEQLLNATYRTGNEEQNYEGSQSPFDIDSHSILYKAKYNISTTDYLTFSADLWEQENKGDSADGLLFYFRGLEAYGYNVVTENSTSNKTTDAFKISYHSEAESGFYDTLDLNLYSNNSEQKDNEFAKLDIDAPMFGVVEIRDMYKDSTFDQHTIGFLSNASKQVNGNHTLGFGVDIEKSTSARQVREYREVDGVPTKDEQFEKFPETDTTRLGVFLNDEISLLDGKLLVTPGMRIDNYEMNPNGALNSKGEEFAVIDETHATFNFGALYKLTDTISAFAQYGQGFKVPAYDLAYIEHYNQPTSTYVYEVVPSDDLSPEESDNFEIGLRGHIDDLFFSVAAYYSTYDNFLATKLIDTEVVSNPDGSFAHIHETYQYQNIDAVTIKGAELSLSYYFTDHVSLFTTASYQDGKNDETGEYIETISPLSGIAGISLEYNQLNTELVVNWADKMDKVNPGNQEVSGYGVVDWKVNYEINSDLKVNLLVSNITNKEYVRYVNVAGHTQGDSLEYLTEPGRSISANITYNF
ncbi:MAG: TonB-dependent hemoglobin/transferrin/lactoferrin family receptor [Colwellia sp.]